ncbi:hypothetical protein EVAR_98826_1 [Eumeta japonica]|uniref:PDZ domain-containing protein n=1 Tax=Eumeta variegata TaxID=151549 RepID=A0A4C1YLQ3_EUMVA|nr:hypothetical protein EVAR_98826_1 [Eumeta japonica]
MAAPPISWECKKGSSPADVDGRLQKGDILASVDGKDLLGADHATAAAAFKMVTNKANIKIKRFKIVR